MRSTFSVSTWTWALAGCLALFLGCSQGEGDRCEIDSDCSGDLTCLPSAGSSDHDKTCRPRSGQGAAGSSGQSTNTTTSTDTGVSTSTDASTPDVSVVPSGGEPDGSAAEPDAALAD